jgi:hypothetical protein
MQVQSAGQRIERDHVRIVEARGANLSGMHASAHVRHISDPDSVRRLVQRLVWDLRTHSESNEKMG